MSNNIDTFFSEIRMYPRYPDRVFVDWDLHNNSISGNYFFSIYLSTSPEDEFDLQNITPVINDNNYNFPFALLFKSEYLWVKIKCEINNKEYWSNPIGLFYHLDRRHFLQAKEIMRQKDLVRSLNCGIKTFLRKRKTFGERCTSCIDEGTGMIDNSNCPICFGTKIIHGFGAPIEVYADIVENSVREVSPSELGTLDGINAIAKFTYPLVNRGDILIEEDRNRRWYVNKVKFTSFKSVPVDQQIDVRLVSPKDIEYKLI